MSKDVKMFTACNHLVDGKSYDLQLCPKCYGKGYYFDISFNKNGDVITSSDDIKLQQEMLKVLIDEKFSNPFHADWGSQVTTMIGSKNTNITKNKVKVMVRQAEEYLQKMQIIEYSTHHNLNNKEMIEEITSVNIDAIGPTGYLVTVLLKNVAEDVYTQTINI